MKSYKKFNNKGQIGETLTWIVATVIILLVLTFFIFGASLLGKTKKVGTFRESLTSKETFEGTDVFLKKSLFTYLKLDKEVDQSFLEKNLENMANKGMFDLPYNETKKEVFLRYHQR